MRILQVPIFFVEYYVLRRSDRNISDATAQERFGCVATTRHRPGNVSITTKSCKYFIITIILISNHTVKPVIHGHPSVQ